MFDFFLWIFVATGGIISIVFWVVIIGLIAIEIADSIRDRKVDPLDLEDLE